MEQSERNEPGRSLTAATLRRDIEKIIENPRLRLLPGGRELTTALLGVRAWVGEVEARLQEHERAVADLAQAVRLVRPAMPEKLRAQLYGLLSTAEREGQLERPIADAARPGGPMAGDIVQPAPVRFGESYGGTDE